MTGDEVLDGHIQRLFDWVLDTEPFFATHMGRHEYDDRVPDASRDRQLRDIETAKGFRADIAAVAPTTLSPGKRVDRSLMLHTLDLNLYEQESLRFWESYPQGASGMGGGLFSLFMRDFAPLPQRMASITARLEKYPAMLEQHKTRITRPVKLWCEIGLESAQRFPGFLAIIGQAGADALEKAPRERLAEGIERTLAATNAYADWVRDDVLPKAVDRIGIGEAAFRELLKHRHLPLALEEIYDLGWKYLKESKEELARIAGQIKPGATVAEAKEIVKGDHPKAFPEALAFTKKEMLAAREFLGERGLATLPAGEELKVIETPTFLRHLIPFAAYSSPGKFEAVQQGIYMVTPVEDKPEMLREFSFAGVRNTAVHEAYPGHHLQLSCANQHPSLARALSDAVETVEGWAHFCEDMMREQGFSADPKTHFVQVMDQAWRACRIIIDVDLHRHKMTFDEAVDFLVKEAGMERPGALAEVKRYTSNPAYQLSYLIGKHLIKGLRDDVRRKMGAKYSDRWFHDAILYAGSMPFTYLREEIEQKLAA